MADKDTQVSVVLTENALFLVHRDMQTQEVVDSLLLCPREPEALQALIMNLIAMEVHLAKEDKPVVH